MTLTPARKEGWRQFVEGPAREQQDVLTRRELRVLGKGALAGYNRSRRVWHANLGPIRTPQLAELHENLWDIVDSNLQDGDRVKGAVAIDAFPGLGKTTSVLAGAGDCRYVLTAGEDFRELLRLPAARIHSGVRAGGPEWTVPTAPFVLWHDATGEPAGMGPYYDDLVIGVSPGRRWPRPRPTGRARPGPRRSAT